MTTKDHVADANSKTFVPSLHISNDQYSNLDLNSFHHSSSQNTSLLKDNVSKKYETPFDCLYSPKKGNDKMWNKLNGFSENMQHSTLNNFKNDIFEKRWKAVEEDESSSTNSSTLSLHIAAYENFNEATNDDIASIQQQQQLSSIEFPRQQDSECRESEVMKFKSSQKLLNPNEASARNVAQKSSNLSKKQNNKGKKQPSESLLKHPGYAQLNPNIKVVAPGKGKNKVHPTLTAYDCRYQLHNSNVISGTRHWRCLSNYKGKKCTGKIQTITNSLNETSITQEPYDHFRHCSAINYGQILSNPFKELSNSLSQCSQINSADNKTNDELPLSVVEPDLSTDFSPPPTDLNSSSINSDSVGSQINTSELNLIDFCPDRYVANFRGSISPARAFDGDLIDFSSLSSMSGQDAFESEENLYEELPPRQKNVRELFEERQTTIKKLEYYLSKSKEYTIEESKRINIEVELIEECLNVIVPVYPENWKVTYQQGSNKKIVIRKGYIYKNFNDGGNDYRCTFGFCGAYITVDDSGILIDCSFSDHYHAGTEEFTEDEPLPPATSLILPKVFTNGDSRGKFPKIMELLDQTRNDLNKWRSRLQLCYINVEILYQLMDDLQPYECLNIGKETKNRIKTALLNSKNILKCVRLDKISK
uniref:FLYWCH-type domain-containing protein n=1 Tax=Panagrolaimus sp. ES5 TaxID=591445 RepID=A0AC34FK07_9BILA